MRNQAQPYAAPYPEAVWREALREVIELREQQRTCQHCQHHAGMEILCHKSVMRPLGTYAADTWGCTLFAARPETPEAT